MKKIRLRVMIYLWLSSTFISMATITRAQENLIHYWHFNNFTGLSTAGDVSLITPVHANWSALDSTKAMISYVPSASVSASYHTYWDANTGDTTNARMGADAGNSLRVRNPSDSMELRFYMPTTGYKNIRLSYALEKSSLTSGQGKQVFDYSTDGGKTWKTSGLSIPGDSVENGNWNLIGVDFSDAAVNDNPDFVFRIKFVTQNTGTKGNNRFDNVALDGDVIPVTTQMSLIHYWHFNNFTGLSTAGNVSLITPVHANWSALDSTRATISYVPSATVSSSYETYWDANTGDTTNARMGADAGSCLRVRNPSDSMELRFNLPTTGYKNIRLSYALEKSSLASGQGKQVFDYSTDGGKTWKTSGLSIPGDSVENETWNLITVDFSGDADVNNNADFVFRIKLVTQNTGTKGNNRFDNVALEGVSINGHTSGVASQKFSLHGEVYPNPVHDFMNVATGSDKAQTISVFNMQGALVSYMQSSHDNTRLNLSSLSNGVYFVRVIENGTGRTASLKFIKN